MKVQSSIGAVLLCLGLLAVAEAQQRKFKLCATSRFTTECNTLQRGTSEVECQIVQDPIECALQVSNESSTTDFGIFTAESALHLATINWDSLVVIKQVRNVERVRETHDFQSVAIVRRKDYRGGFSDLHGMTFCHPGLEVNRQNRWSERFLKHFERTAIVPQCGTDGSSPAEIEASALARTFAAACRPGPWSNNVHEDKELKSRFPNLCAKCDNKAECSYNTALQNPHQRALECLKRGGDVTYVSREEARRFFDLNEGLKLESSYLCPNGSIQAVANNANPCVWLTQPWGTIIANRNAIPRGLKEQINRWLMGTSAWETAFKDIVEADNSKLVDVVSIESPRDYFLPYRPLPVEADLCNTKVNWCTTSYEEREKCQTIRAGGISTGVYPLVECRDPQYSVVACLNDIKSGRSDFMGIDSNYGWLARHVYNLTGALFEETESELYSKVVILVKAHSDIKRFEDLKKKKACFPEFGGIASIAFVAKGRDRGIFPKNVCNYGKLLGNYFGDSCLPGARDKLHDPSGDVPENLCSLCKIAEVQPVYPPVYPGSTINTPAVVPPVQRAGLFPSPDPAPSAQPSSSIPPSVTLPSPIPSSFSVTLNTSNSTGLSFNVTLPVNGTSVPLNRTRRQTYVPSKDACSPSSYSKYFRTGGALQCLTEVGDVAVVELQKLKLRATELGLNQHDYRILCKNGSMSAYTGFDVDDDCTLTEIVDGEIVVSRGSKKTASVVQVLASFDKYFLNDPRFLIYNHYNGVEDLLFEDSALGVVSRNETNKNQAVESYIRLFEQTDSCVERGGAAITSISLLSVLLAALLARLF